MERRPKAKPSSRVSHDQVYFLNMWKFLLAYIHKPHNLHHSNSYASNSPLAIFLNTSKNVSVSCAPLMANLSLMMVNGTPEMPRICAFWIPAATTSFNSSEARNSFASEADMIPADSASRARSSCEPGSPSSSK